MADGTFFNVAREVVLLPDFARALWRETQGLNARRAFEPARVKPRSVELYPSAPDGCVAVVREPGFDEYGAKTTHRIHRGADGYRLVTTREFYRRDGSVDDYDVTTHPERFADLALALKAAGVEPEGER
jgi:hypothetical protein